MKSNILKYVACAAVTLGLAATVQAVQITGTVRMSGDVTLDTTSLATANNATAFAAVTVVGSPTGSFAGTGGAVVTWKPFGWNPSTAPVPTLWTYISGLTYSFDLGTITGFTRTDATLLFVQGTGTVRITGFDPTAANWTFTITDSSAGTAGDFVFGFADSNTAVVPDGGATVMLLGAALSGLALIRRKLA